MEVLCERCHTEYDFDDALVSERGTTVKCTNCGHQFRIFRPRTANGAPERWVVRTRNGTDLVYTSLRDLQRAITRSQVGRDDILTREGVPSRKLAQIAELEPFFPKAPDPDSERAATLPPVRDSMATPRGLGPPVDPGSEVGMDRRPTVPRSINARAMSEADLDFDDLTSPVLESFTVPPRRAADSADEPTAVQERRSLSSPGRVRAPGDVVIRDDPRSSFTPTPSDVRTTYTASDEPAFDSRDLPGYVPMRSSSAARWVVGLVVLGGLGLLGATMGKRYLTSSTQSASVAAPSDARVVKLLEDSDRQLMEGDVESAKASLDKASALAEREPKVLVQLARLAAVRADLPWLKGKLLGPDQADVARVAKAELSDRAQQAAAASERALQVSPDDPDALRMRIDALRLSGSVAEARQLVGRLPESNGQPEVAYTLAALDMTDPSPNWTTIVDRLRTAAAGEKELGRARGALAYALAQSGDLDGARAELATLQAATRPYPLLLELQAFLKRRPAAATDGGAPVAEGGASPGASAIAAAGRVSESAAGSEALPNGSYQQLLQRAHAARQAGKLDEAEALFKSVLASQPGDTEALAGLGDIAKARGDKTGSVSYYEEVAKQNPSYIPALAGLADAKWEAGDYAAAAGLYRQVLDRTGGEGPYGAKARARIAEASKRSGTAPAETVTPPSPGTGSASRPPASSTTAPGDKKTPPGVDTSDLPGWTPP